MVLCHIKVLHISPTYDAYLNQIIARAHVFDSKLNLKLNQEMLDTVYWDYQCDTFKIDNALVNQILSKVFTDTNAFVYLKQRKSTQDGWAMFFDIHKHFLSPNHVARLATKAEIKLQSFHYDGERSRWD